MSKINLQDKFGNEDTLIYNRSHTTIKKNK